MGVLDTNQVDFVVGVSQGTGIDPRVVIAWMQNEGAFKSGGTGGYNYLNIRPFAQDNHAAISSGGFSQFSNVQDAIKATVAVLHQPNMRPIIATAKTKPTPKQQIAAIAATPWDSSHYGGNGGQNLVSTFTKYFKTLGLNDHYIPPDQARSLATDFQANASDWTSIDMNSVTNAASDAATAVENAVMAPIQEIEHAFSWLGNNWDRVLFVVGGVILVILGIVIIGKGNNTFTFARGDE